MDMKVKLSIQQNNQIKTLDLNKQTVNHLPFESQAAYQLLDENNQVIEHVYWKNKAMTFCFS